MPNNKCDWKEDPRDLEVRPPNALGGPGWIVPLHMVCFTCGATQIVRSSKDQDELFICRNKSDVSSSL